MKKLRKQAKFKSRNRNKFLAGIAMVILLFLGFVSSIILINQRHDDRSQASFTGGALINFKKVGPFPKNTLVSVPVYLDTQNIDLNLLNLKINIVGEVESLGIKINSKLPIKKVDEKIEDKSVFISLTELEPDQGWNTNQDTELLKLNFIYDGDGEIGLSFDQKETIAKSAASDENIITLGENTNIRIGNITPAEVAPVQTEVISKTTDKKNNDINNNLLIGIITSSFLAFFMTTLYISRNQKREKQSQTMRVAA
ncbi:MAG: hypothetical protein UT13_C0001G0667 [Candidatus Pacebacteria bacterium GW2011_GWF2_38_9]|nr:MAG: hypothetical protein US01_C0001G0698 [candidate division TM6 bacterium GW2011_GWF2_28_16]KKQ10063.1 MAG: hypothetical protein US20_C0003G0002 [Candidatus Pacebacteria bacterium GW2011_GWF1_36_5]KKQ89020.1 MAG: hypothetical protein UT13_C0001G0667 [Candidatus Pacebacteria bacterium GW2011_GWF2_38_9]HAZ73196.1 hypothetical protein [Candidatus Paceibacterota bacterium]